MQRQSPSFTVAQFTAAAVASIAIITIGTFILAHGVARREAVRNASNVTLATGANAIAPVLQDGILSRDPAAIAAVDTVVRDRVVKGDIVRVKLWARDGTILYSDEPSNIGRQFQLDEDELKAFDGVSVAGVSDLDKPENETERDFDKLLEVYDSIETPSGQPVLFEAYLRYDAVERSASRLLTAIAPALAGGLIVLLLVQIPLALGLARRLEAGVGERERLLRRNVETTETERRRIAADLHDGVVQSLVGNSYLLTAAANEAESNGLSQMSKSLNTSASDLRTAVRELRTLIVTIAPPRLRDEGLEAAIFDLTTSLQQSGVDVQLSIENVDQSEQDRALVYRVVQEAVRNVAKHANATELSVTVTSTGKSVRCVVKDNGSGFDNAAHLENKSEGHVGLHLLEELINDAGGKLVVESTIGSGTTLTAELPAK